MPEAENKSGAQETGELRKAAFAGGCFWCMEHPFDKVPGVVSVTPGYTGGHKENPTYEEVSSGDTGHAEAVLVIYDPGQVDYEKLLAIFWHNIDPTTRDRQFCDVGHQYRTAVFYFDDEQRRLALASMEQMKKTGRLKGMIATEIVSAGEFYPAEDYHQQYYMKNPSLYETYRAQCGRDERLKELWGNEAEEKKEEKTGKERG